MCILRLHSEAFSFTEFAKETQMPVVQYSMKNEPRYAGSKRLNKYYSLTLKVSDLEFDNIQGQINDAISFLRTWEYEIVRLISLNNTIEACLVFPLYSRFDDNIIVQNDNLPKELIIPAGRIGLSIEMSIYDKNTFVDTDT